MVFTHKAADRRCGGGNISAVLHTGECTAYKSLAAAHAGMQLD